MNRVNVLIGILIGVVTLVGVGYKLDYRWSRPSMVDHEILAASVRGVEVKNALDQIGQIEDRYRGVPEHEWSGRDVDRYRRLKKRLSCLEQGRKDCPY